MAGEIEPNLVLHCWAADFRGQPGFAWRVADLQGRIAAAGWHRDKAQSEVDGTNALAGWDAALKAKAAR